MSNACAQHALSGIASRLTKYTLGWTVAVLLASIWLIHDRVNHHRFDEIQAGQYRLNSLHESLNLTFQQLTGLSRALGRQHAILDFLSHIHIEWSSTMSESDRALFTKALHARTDVQDLSNTLRDAATDF